MSNIVRSQFIYCENPTIEGGEKLIYHSKFPRFFAKIINGGNNDFELEIDEMIDEVSDDYDISGKLKRAGKWYDNYKIWQRKNNHY